MKHNVIVALSMCLIALALRPAPLSAQDGKMLNARDPLLRFKLLERVARGQNAPTTVQSISIREAEYYGISVDGRKVGETAGEPNGTIDGSSDSTSDGSSDGQSSAFFRGNFSLQPFIVGWNGLDLGRWNGDGDAACKDASVLERLRLDDPVVLVGMEFGAGSLYGTSSIDFGTDTSARYADESGVTGFWKPLDVLSYWTFPHEGYLGWSNHNITVAAGRLREGLGLGDENILLNGNARWYDQLQFSWWSDKAKFFSFLGTSSSRLDEAEYAIQSWTTQDGDTASWGWDSVNNHDAATQSTVPIKLFTYHRVELKPFARIGFGISEMQLVGGAVPDLTNLLPTTVWHNTYSAGVSNVMMAADIWSVPIDGLLAWGEFLMDDSKAPAETGAAKPNCWAWELGATYVLPARSEGWLFAASAEWSHVDKWTYARWQPYLTMYQRQMMTGGHRGYDIPLGHTEGGDVDKLKISFEAIADDGKRIELGYAFIDKGPVYLGRYEKNPAWTGAQDATHPEYLPVYYDYDNLTGVTGSLDALLGSTRKYSHVVTLDATWPFGACWEANAGVDVRRIINVRHVKGELALETTYTAGLTWAYGK